MRNSLRDTSSGNKINTRWPSNKHVVDCPNQIFIKGSPIYMFHEFLSKKTYKIQHILNSKISDRSTQIELSFLFYVFNKSKWCSFWVPIKLTWTTPIFIHQPPQSSSTWWRNKVWLHLSTQLRPLTLQQDCSVEEENSILLAKSMFRRF